MPNQVKNGNRVRIHYTTYSADDCLIETSENREPLEFVIGGPDVISGISRGLIGMRRGDHRQITLSPDQAFDNIDPQLVTKGPRSSVPDHVSEGEQLTLRIAGSELSVWVKGVEGDEVTLDMNHPLAGETLKYDIRLVDII